MLAPVLEPVAAAVGLPTGVFLIVFGLVASVPLGAIAGVMPSATTKHGFNAAVGIGVCVGLYGQSGLNVAVSVVFSWLAMLASPQHCATVVCTGTMGYLIYLHIFNASGLAWQRGEIDFTGSQMIITSKLTAIALNVADGYREKVAAAVKVLTPEQQRKRLSSPPGLLELVGYTLSPMTVLSGPFVEFVDYRDWADSKGDWAPSAIRPATSSRYLSVAKAVLEALICVGVHLYISGLIDLMDFVDSTWAAQGLGSKVVWLWIFSIGMRCKYYFAWKLAEAACNASGLGMRVVKDKSSGSPAVVWDRCVGCVPLKVEWPWSSVNVPRYWNMCTGNWLRFYVYERVPSIKELTSSATHSDSSLASRRPPFYAVYITQLVSGVWHGVYPGYWLFFFFSAVAIEASRTIYKGIEERLQKNSVSLLLVQLLHSFSAILVLNYMALTFLLLEAQKTLDAWSNLSYIGHVALVLMLVCGKVGGMILQKPTKKEGKTK